MSRRKKRPDDPLCKQLQAELLDYSDHDLARALRRIVKMLPEEDVSDWIQDFALEVPAHVARFGSFKGAQRTKAIEVVAQLLTKLQHADRLTEWQQ